MENISNLEIGDYLMILENDFKYDGNVIFLKNKKYKIVKIVKTDTNDMVGLSMSILSENDIFTGFWTCDVPMQDKGYKFISLKEERKLKIKEIFS